MKTAQDSFKPFEDFINNSIKAMEKKEVSSGWKKLKDGKSAKLELIGCLYEVPKRTTIQIKTGKMPEI